ncbi:MAG: beta-lactamase family protein [Acidobacteria bacterium]|nr:beta-lactamase family protein [Acidobacteriota bacterium]
MSSQNRIVALAVAAVMICALAPSGFAQGSTSTEQSATDHLKAYLEAFNSGVPGQMRAFFEAHFAASALKEIPIEQRVTRFRGAKAELKSMQIEKIISEQPFQTFLLTKAGNGEYVLLKATVEKTPPHKLASITIELVEDPANIVVPEPKADEKELIAAVRTFLEGQTRADEFSGVVLIAKDSRILFHEAYGDADREKKIPNRKDTKFNLGSINKNFTRVAIHQLATQGKLSLDDPIKKFLPDYPNAQAAEKVTIRHLLNMASGIGDFFGSRYDATPKDKIRTLQDYLPLFADLPLEFEPGTNNRYSNGGYVVLGIIIEKVGGVDYYTYVRENIFKPCGMLNTDSFARDANVPNLAWGYALEGESATARVLNHATLPGRGSSAGGGYSTAEDMLKYTLALKDKKVYLPDAANGLGIAGGAPGINSVLEWDPRSGYTIIVLTNFDPPTAGQAARRIVGWLPQ